MALSQSSASRPVWLAVSAVFGVGTFVPAGLTELVWLAVSAVFGPSYVDSLPFLYGALIAGLSGARGTTAFLLKAPLRQRFAVSFPTCKNLQYFNTTKVRLKLVQLLYPLQATLDFNTTKVRLKRSRQRLATI